MQALVIDDSRAVRMIIGNILRDMEIEVFEAGDGQQGLEQLDQHPEVGIILVDWNMPVMNGYEFILAVRSQRSNDHIRIMMVTTEAESEQVTKALSAGANEYLMKPFTRDILMAKLSLMDV